METAQLYSGLTFLAYATGVIVIIVGGMLAVVLFNLTKLTKNLNETAEIVKTEITPTLKNINKSVEIVSGVIIKTDEKISRVKEFIKKTPLNIISKVFAITGSVSKGFWGGLASGLKIFSKWK
jgi:predicted PurR-regulated permease PerM